MLFLQKYYGLVFIFFISCSSAQRWTPVTVCSLPEPLKESSGLETGRPGFLWSHNDSGDSARFFEIDTNGNLLRTIKLSGVKAVDIEDMTQDAEGNLYFGDFGNNANNRQDLCIYKIPGPDLLASDSVTPRIIRFSFEDQLQFPPPPEEQNFDCEAFFHHGGSLYLFSKNRGSSGYCKMYRIPDQEGYYTAALIDSFDTRTWITSADLSPDARSMVLLSYNRIWVFSGIQGTDFLKGAASEVLIDSTQKEAIVFINDTAVYLTDEYSMGTGGKLYYLNLASWILGIDDYRTLTEDVSIVPIPSSGNATIRFFNHKTRNIKVSLISESGQRFHLFETTIHPGKIELPVHAGNLPSGQYILSISSRSRRLFSGILLLNKP